VKVLALFANQTETDNGKLIAQWLDQVGREKHTVTTATMPAGCSIGDVHEVIRSKAPDGHVQMFGALPAPQVRSGVDGHVYESGPEQGQLRSGDCLAPYCSNDLSVWGPEATPGRYSNEWGFLRSPAVRTVSILDGSNLSQFGSEAACLDRMIANNLAYRTGAVDYGSEACYVDYLEQLSPIRASIIADLQSVVGGDVHVHDTSTADESLRWHWFQQNAGKRFLVGGFFDGGLGRDGGVGMWNTGSMADFASGSVMVAVALMFCSNAWMWRYWPLQRAALLGGAVATIYDPWGRFGLSGWDEVTPLASVLLPQMQANQAFVHAGVGDYTVVRRIGEVASDPRVDDIVKWQMGVDQTLQDLKAAVATLKGAGGGTSDTTGVIVITKATYINTEGPCSWDRTDEVKALVAAGFPWDAGHNLSDPIVGKIKRVEVEGTRGGVPFKRTLLQWEKW
jgi:hypothetical protein